MPLLSRPDERLLLCPAECATFPTQGRKVRRHGRPLRFPLVDASEIPPQTVELRVDAGLVGSDKQFLAALLDTEQLCFDFGATLGAISENRYIVRAEWRAERC
jgi:hypothetical protein